MSRYLVGRYENTIMYQKNFFRNNISAFKTGISFVNDSLHAKIFLAGVHLVSVLFSVSIISKCQSEKEGTINRHHKLHKLMQMDVALLKKSLCNMVYYIAAFTTMHIASPGSCQQPTPIGPLS